MSYPPPPGSYPPPQPAYGGPQDHPKGTQILVFGILGLVCCAPFGIAAWVMGNGVLREIDAAPGLYANRGTVNAGRICGIVATILWIAGLAFYAIMLGLGVGLA